MKRYKSIYSEITSIYRIQDPNLHYIADRLQLNMLPTDFKAIKKLNDNKLLQAFSKKSGQEFQRMQGVKPFDLKDLIAFDKSLSQKPPATKTKSKVDWSKSVYLGQMNWDDAMAKAKFMNMRLPTKYELLDACKSGIMKFWPENGKYYWSSSLYTEYNKDSAYAVRSDFSDNIGCVATLTYTIANHCARSLPLDAIITKQIEQYSIFKDSKVLSHITKDLSTWTGAQRFITNLDNHVLQFNIDWKWLKRFLILKNIPLPFVGNEHIENYIKNSNHPTSRTKLTLGWCRFTILKPGVVDGNLWHDKKNADAWAQDLQQTYGEKWREMHREFIEISDKSVILDEIQTDLNGNQFLGEELMQGWDEYVMRRFINFVRGSLKVRKIYIPTYETKQDLYSASPLMSLYKELPNRFGFKKNSDLKGFMLLERRL